MNDAKMRVGTALLLLSVCGLCAAFLRLSLHWSILLLMVVAAFSVMVVWRSARHSGRAAFVSLSFIVLYGLSFGVGSLAWTNPNDLLSVTRRGLLVDSVAPAVVLCAVGLAAWLVGFSVGPLRVASIFFGTTREWAFGGQRVLSLRSALLVYLVGLFSKFMLLALGQFGFIVSDLEAAVSTSSSYGSILSLLSSFSNIGLSLLALVAFQDRKNVAVAALCVAGTVEVAFGLLSGTKSAVLMSGLGVAVAYVYVTRRVPVSGILIGGAVFLVLVPYNSAYREEVRDESGTTVQGFEAVGVVPESLISSIGELGPASVASVPRDFVTQRMRTIDGPAIVMQRTPSDVPYVPPSETVLTPVVSLVPRALWPSKPVYAEGLDFAREYWAQDVSVYNSLSPSFPGDMYRRGGWLGLIVGMGVLGSVVRALEEAFNVRQEPGALPLLLLAWTQLAAFEGTPTLMIAGLIQAMAFGVLALRLAGSAKLPAAGASNVFAGSVGLQSRRSSLLGVDGRDQA